MDQTAIILRPKSLERFARYDLLPMIAFRHLRSMHYEHKRPDRLHLWVANLEVDGHGLLQRGVGPTARAEAAGPSQHNQAASHLLDITNQHCDLGIAKVGQLLDRATVAWCIGQNDAVVSLQFGQTPE